ncbi:MAG: DUF4835 family protein [Bacteroidetes bacterium]|nr:DUF4835 family protein [Bacteroidota bacterium]
MRNILYLSILFLFLVKNSFAQELKCVAQVATPQIEGTDKKVYETLQTSIYEFMNSKKWTNNTFGIDEKIECSILITISERVSQDEFKGTIQVQSRRPIYKTSYSSTLFNFVDKDFTFKYIESQSLDFNENSFMSNLTSVLGYYAYIVIGLDYDSYSPYGGSPFYEKAQTIVNNAQNAADKGWKSFESQKNRYWLVENLMNKSYSGVRDCIYQYHRKGLDMMTENNETARGSITTGMESMQKVYKEKPSLFIFQVFFSAKSDELVNIYSQGSPMEKTRVVNILNVVDPANSNKYKKILNP